MQTGTSRKRKTEQVVPGPAKKLAVDRSENDEPISFTSEKCSTLNSDNIVKGAVAAYNGNVYFGSGDAIHVLNVNHKKPRWFPKIDCNRTHFGLTALGDTLLAVGGLLKSSPGKNTATNTVQCYALCSKDASKEKTWEEKYPAMGVARFDPEVVSVENYVIVIAGWTELVGEYERNNPVLAVEILDVNREKWYSIKSMALPNEIKTLEWQSACICNDTLYLAVKHDDPEYDNLKKNSSNIDEDSNSGFPFGSESDNSDCYPEKPYKCYSLYECSLEDLSQLAEMSEHDQSSFSWQKLNHPHPAVYENENQEIMCTSYVGMYPSEDDIEEYHSKGGLDSNYIQTEFFHYNYCNFTLSCIGDHLIAVGCKHVAAIAPGDMRYSLNRTYESYKVIMASLFRYDNEPYETPIDYDVHSETRSKKTECHVHIYDPDKDSWKQLYSTQNPHGHSDNQPVVTAVDNKLVIVRGSKAACVCTFDLK